MAARSYMPERDHELLTFSTTFLACIQAAGAMYGISPGQVAQYQTLHDAYAAGLAACEPNIRSRSTCAVKNASRDALKANLRMLVSIAKGQPSLTDAQKIELGLTVPAPRSPIARPVTPPSVSVVSVIGRTVRIRLSEFGMNKRAKPRGCEGAAVFSFTGEAPPADASLWHFNSTTSRTTMEIVFPDTIASGAQVWFTAYWYNPRAQRGPGSSPICTHIQGGGVAVKAMRVAA